MTSSNGNIFQWPVKSPHKDQWRGVLMFSLISARINGWVNIREAGDLRRHRAHYDVIVMIFYHLPILWWCRQLKSTPVDENHSSVFIINAMASQIPASRWLLNRLFRRRKKSKLRVTGICDGIHPRPGTRKMFPFDDVIISSFLLYAHVQNHGCWWPGSRSHLINSHIIDLVPILASTARTAFTFMDYLQPQYG